MKTCSCTFQHHNETDCDRCNYVCEDGRIVKWPAPDFDKWTVEIGDGIVVLREKRKR